MYRCIHLYLCDIAIDLWLLSSYSDVSESRLKIAVCGMKQPLLQSAPWELGPVSGLRPALLEWQVWVIQMSWGHVLHTIAKQTSLAAFPHRAGSSSRRKALAWCALCVMWVLITLLLQQISLSGSGVGEFWRQANVFFLYVLFCALVDSCVRERNVWSTAT